MNTKVIGQNIINKESVESTNNYAVELIKTINPAEGTVVLTNNQTNGRGQGGNFWESEPFMNLTFSIIFHPKFIAPSNQFNFNKAISLGIIDYLQTQISEIPVKIKWPNDIYVGNKKIAGILIENTITGNEFSSSVAGIGLNVNQTIFKSNAPNPISLKMILNNDFSIFDVLQGICINIEKRYLDLKSRKIKKINSDYLSNLYLYQEFSNYKYKNKSIKAKITGVSEFGELELIDIKGKKLKCMFKEIDLIL